MAIRDNNGKRLLSILDGLKAGQPNESTKAAIKRLFADAEDRRIGVYIGEIFSLANTVTKQLSSILDHEEVHLKWIVPVYQGLSSLSVNGNTNGFHNAYTDVAKAYLESASFELGRHFPDPDIDSEKLQDIYAEISGLIDKIGDDNTLDDNLRKFIIDKLLSIQDIVAHAQLMDYTALVTATESALGGILLRTGNSEAVNQLKEKSASFAQYLDWLGRLLALITAAQIGYKCIDSGIAGLIV